MTMYAAAAAIITEVFLVSLILGHVGGDADAIGAFCASLFKPGLWVADQLHLPSPFLDVLMYGGVAIELFIPFWLILWIVKYLWRRYAS